MPDTNKDRLFLRFAKCPKMEIDRGHPDERHQEHRGGPNRRETLGEIPVTMGHVLAGSQQGMRERPL